MTGIRKDKLLRAWVLLLLFSSISTGVAVMIDRGNAFDTNGWINAAAGTVILGLALIKGRIILSRYLGLDSAPFWRRGFNFGLTIYALSLLALYLAPLI